MLLTIFKLKKYFVKKKKANYYKINAERYKKEFADFLSLAKSKIEQFSLNNWQVSFDHAQRRAGVCYYDKKLISFSIKFLRKANDEERVDTLLHEIAHAIVGPGNGHNLIWKKKAIEIGCSGQIYQNFEFSEPKWIKFCSNGCWEQKSFRRKRNLICKFCMSAVEFRQTTRKI